MNKSVIDGVDFYTIFKAGTDSVVKNKENLNLINVFPVRDGDTGTNLALTMNSIADEATVSEDFDIVIQSMSDAAFENARGNSGIIFASFINGFSNACGHLKSLTLEQFTYGASIAVKEAYSAVSSPVEGTMLTVIREWANYMTQHYKSHNTFGALFDGAYQKAVQVLNETPDMLEVLRRNKVVDSGAKGFVMFLEGFSNRLNEWVHPEIKQDFKSGDIEIYSDSHRFSDSVHRYCTEVLVRNSIHQKEAVEALLEDMGDSLIVTGNQKLLKIHVHTNQPDEVTKRLIASNYKIYKSKVEDMKIQEVLEQSQKSKIAILTDSIADIEDDRIIDEQIHVLPLTLIADDSLYLDKLTATPNNIQMILDKSVNYPTSSQPDVKQIRIKLDWLLSRYEQVIIISVSSALSGTYSNFSRVVEELGDSRGRVKLIDSKLNSGAQGLVVLKAAELANQGLTAEHIAKVVTEEIKKASIYVSLDTFKYAVKGGRVPTKVGKVLVALKAKPIMSLDVDGNGTAFGISFSRKAVDEKIKKHIKKITLKEGIDRYAIVHANNPELAKLYSERYEAVLGMPPEYVTSISAITSIHAGIGAVAIAIIRR